MVLDLGVSNLPMAFFMVVHLAATAIAATLAMKAFNTFPQGRLFGWAFTFFGIGEVLYMGYHLKITTFLLSHTLAEVLNLVAFILVFTAATQNVLERKSVAQKTTTRT